MKRAESYALTLILLIIFPVNSTAQQQGQRTIAGASPAENAAKLPAVSVRTQTAEEINDAGCLLADARQYEKAIEQFKLAISLKPQLFDAHLNLGLVYGWSGRAAEAIAPLREATRLAPSNAKAHFNLGLVYYHTGRVAEAIKSLERTLALRPDYDGAHEQLGAIYDQAGRREESLRHYAEAARLNPTAAAFNNLGVTLAKAKRYEEAATALGRAVELQPRLAQAQYNLGTLYLTMKNKRAAVGVQAALREIDPELGRKLFYEIHRDKILSVKEK